MLNKQDLVAIEKILDKKIALSNKKLTSLDSKITTMQKDISQIRSDQKAIISFFDKEFIELGTRVENIERHLGIGTN